MRRCFYIDVCEALRAAGRVKDSVTRHKNSGVLSQEACMLNTELKGHQRRIISAVTCPICDVHESSQVSFR